LVDDGRFDELVELYAEDAIHESQGAVHRGRAAIRDFVAALPLDGVRHFTSNTLIDADGRTARAKTDWLALRPAEGTFTIFAAGRYHDRLVNRRGRWLFVERRNERLS
jgi:hypothetical protein